MTDNFNMLDRFNSISDMPVSEEMLGSYIEHNLDADEMAAVEAVILEDPFVEQLALDVETLPDPYEPDTYHEVDLEDIVLPDPDALLGSVEENAAGSTHSGDIVYPIYESDTVHALTDEIPDDESADPNTDYWILADDTDPTFNADAEGDDNDSFYDSYTGFDA